MERLWAPWRLQYIVADRADGCIFCTFGGEREDRENLILRRGERAFVIMNAFPYSNGHLLVAPYRHVSDLAQLDEEESLDIMRLTQASILALGEAYSPDGINTGINQGAAAGAGIVDHIHVHVVPRWEGDTNFMPIFADVKVIPEALEATYDKLKPIFDGL